MKYANGDAAEVGDLIEFGTRHKRYIVTSINDESDGKHVFSGSWKLALSLCKLIARHGETAK